MKSIGPDIILFENFLDKEIIKKLLLIRKESITNSRINLFEKDETIFYEFVKFWNENIESTYYDYYFKVYDVDKGIGYNTDGVESAIKSLKDWIKTRWRDVFLLHYEADYMNDGYKKIHWDFSGLTAIFGLNEDYLGGELVFPLQNTTIKINTGDIVIFPGGITHPHFVNSVTQGVRDVLVAQSLNLEQDHKINYV